MSSPIACSRCSDGSRRRRRPTRPPPRARRPDVDLLESLVRIAWLIGAAGFVFGLMRMNSPATARNGNLISAGGMALAIGGTAVFLASQGEAGLTAWLIILAGVAVGGGLGLYTA